MIGWCFYLFINIKNTQNDSMKFCADLLESKGVALVPGLAFGMKDMLIIFCYKYVKL